MNDKFSLVHLIRSESHSFEAYLEHEGRPCTDILELCARISAALNSANEPLLSAEHDEEPRQAEEALPEKPAKDVEEDSNEAERRAKEEWQSSLAPTVVSILILWMLKMVQQVIRTAYIVFPCKSKDHIIGFFHT